MQPERSREDEGTIIVLKEDHLARKAASCSGCEGHEAVWGQFHGGTMHCGITGYTGFSLGSRDGA